METVPKTSVPIFQRGAAEQTTSEPSELQKIWRNMIFFFKRKRWARRRRRRRHGKASWCGGIHRNSRSGGGWGTLWVRSQPRQLTTLPQNNILFLKGGGDIIQCSLGSTSSTGLKKKKQQNGYIKERSSHNPSHLPYSALERPQTHNPAIQLVCAETPLSTLPGKGGTGWKTRPQALQS